MASKIRNAVINYSPLFGLPGVEFRLHNTTLYNSIYRADDEMLANGHLYGVGAYMAPVLHIQRVPGGELFDAYAESVEGSGIQPGPSLHLPIAEGLHCVSRIDYFRDPNAPKANSVVPSVTAVVRDDRDGLLIIHKTDNDLWALPGGGHDIGERIGDTVVREVLEETGITAEIDGIVGLYTDPEHVLAYDDGEVRQQFSDLLPRPPNRRLPAYKQRVERGPLG